MVKSAFCFSLSSSYLNTVKVENYAYLNTDINGLNLKFKMNPIKPLSSRRHIECSMLLDGFAGISNNPRVPRSIKDAVNELKESLQSALSNKQSRMEINFPPGCLIIKKLGVLKSSGCD